MPTLEVKLGNNIERFELADKETVIGRYPFCDVVLSVQSVSRQHARITHSDGGYVIEDLNSQNGTFVNGKRVEGRTRLSDQDRIQIYEIPIIFHERTLGPNDVESTLQQPLFKPPEKRLSAKVVQTVDASIDQFGPAVEAKLRAVLEIVRNLGSTLNIDEVLPKILDSLFTVFPQADRGYILMAEGPNNELVLSQIKDRREHTDEVPTLGPISKAIVDRVMSEGQAVLTRDAVEDDQESVLEVPIRSMICAPLMGPSRKPLGIIHVYTYDRTKPFRESDLEVLVSVATVAGQAVEHARQHEGVLQLHRKREEESRRHAIELERYARELEQFAFVGSHDLKTPLRAIAGCSEILQRQYAGQLDDQAKELIGHTVDAAMRMKQLLDGLLTFSEVRRGGRPFGPVDCNRLIDEVTANLKPQIEAAGATVTHLRLPTIQADHDQMVTLFQNLIDNAIKFRGTEPPVIHISCKPKDGKWLFAVRDNGIGIESQYFDRIFVLFQRLHQPESFPGIGAGLAICKRIVERHGGTIFVRSQLNNGSVFFFTIPAHAVERAKVELEPLPHPSTATETVDG